MNTHSTTQTHASNQLREEFLEWLDSYEPDQIKELDILPVESLLNALENCNNVLPAGYCDQLEIPKGSTYAEAIENVRQFYSTLKLSASDIGRMPGNLPDDDNLQSPSQGKVAYHEVIDGDNTNGWIHTHGMDALGLPELEIRNCPLFLGEFAAEILRTVCDYMLDSGKVVKAGRNHANLAVHHF